MSKSFKIALAVLAIVVAGVLAYFLASSEAWQGALRRIKIPTPRVTEKPFIGPDPKTKRINAVRPVVILASKIEDNEYIIGQLTVRTNEQYSVNINVAGKTLLNSGTIAAPTTSAHDIGNFLSTTTTQTSLNINPILEIKSIYVDNEERKSIALSSAEYLGYQVQRVISNGNSTNDISIDLKDINKPVKQLYFMIRRTDFENINLWSNFTNWYIKDVPIYGQNHDSTYPNEPLTITSSNIKYYKTQSLLKSAELKLDLHSLTVGDPTDYTGASQSLEGKGSIFFNLLQNYNGNKGMPSEGIYNVNFNIDAGNETQPNGVCNMSAINKKELKLYLNEVHTDSSFSFNYNILVFAMNYEIMKFMGGTMGTAYSN